MILAVDCRMKEGVGTVVRNVVPIIARDVNRVKVFGDPLSLAQWNDGSFVMEVVPFTARVYSVKEQLAYPISALSDCQLLHVPHFNVPFRRVPCPMVVTIHDTAHLAGVLPMNHLYRSYARLYYSVAVRKAAHITTVSEFSKNEIVQRLGVPGERITVISCGVDRNLFRPVGQSDFEKVAGRFSIRRPYLMMLGSVRPHKNVGTALKAFKILKHQMKIPHQLVIVGKRGGFRINKPLPEMDDVTARDIIFTDFIDDESIVALYSFADVFIFPSVYEGFGSPPLEAMACGAPVAVSHAASIPEVVGDAGVYFDPYSVDEMVKAIDSLITDAGKRERAVSASLKRAQLFNWPERAKDYLRVYQQVVERAG